MTVFLGKNLKITLLSIYYEFAIFTALFKGAKVHCTDPRELSFCPKNRLFPMNIQLWTIMCTTEKPFSQADVHSKVAGKPYDIGGKTEKVCLFSEKNLVICLNCIYFLHIAWELIVFPNIFMVMESLIYKSSSFRPWNSWGQSLYIIGLYNLSTYCMIFVF